MQSDYKVLVPLFFIAYLILGVSIYKDFGIHWDHDSNRGYGKVIFQVYVDTLTGGMGSSAVDPEFEQIHGPAFEVILEIIERIWSSGDTRDAAFLRHFSTFLVFYLGVFFFYLLCKRHFESWKLGLIGSLFLILSPRTFAHSFYNSIDIACLSLFIISIYTLIVFLDKKTYARVAAHALACAVLIDIRNFGVFVPLLTFFFIALDGFQSKSRKQYLKNILPLLALYTSLLMLFTVLFWPYLWADPFSRFVQSFGATTDVQWLGPVLYFGEFITTDNLPWHYNFGWMLITIPLIYSFAFVLGSFVVFKSFSSRSAGGSTVRNNFIFVLWLGVPLVAPVILQSTLFDDWRHHYFVYPAFLMISLTGIVYLIDLVKSAQEKVVRPLMRTLAFVIAASLVPVVDFMVRYHPYQNVYLNAVAGDNLRDRFDLDYWGLSYREALEYILKNDPSATIKVAANTYSGVANLQILPIEDRKRISYVAVDEASYFLSEHRWHRDDYPYNDEFFSVSVDGEKIMVVYKLK